MISFVYCYAMLSYIYWLYSPIVSVKTYLTKISIKKKKNKNATFAQIRCLRLLYYYYLNTPAGGLLALVLEVSYTQ